MTTEENNGNSLKPQVSQRSEDQTWSGQDEETWSVPTDKLPHLKSPPEPVDGSEQDEETWSAPTGKLVPSQTPLESVNDSEPTLATIDSEPTLVAVDDSEPTIPAVNDPKQTILATNLPALIPSSPLDGSLAQETTIVVGPPPSYEGGPASGVAFPYASLPASGPVPYAGPMQRGPYVPGRQSFKLNRPTLIALIVVVVLFIIGSLYGFVLHDIIPAASAIVKITPASQHMSGQYPLTAQFNSTDSTKNAVGAHSISTTSPEKSMNVQATGKGHQDATPGRGTVTVTMLSGSISASTALHIPSNSGVNVVITIDSAISAGGGAHDFSAQTENTGPGGNIGAYDVNNTYELQNNASVTFTVVNANAFTGGQDANDYTFVQQSDIDSAATQLEAQMSDTDTRTATQNKLGANEQFISDIQCKPNVNPNHQANDKANDVTVKVTYTCEGIAYDTQKLFSVVDPQLEQQVISQYGTGYNLDKQLTTSIPAGTVNEDDNAKTVSFEVDAQGVWIFHISDGMKQDLASLIVGKKQADATTLLSQQRGVAKSNITTSGGLGVALPSSPNNIQVVVLGDQP
ncbi:MAG TPA: hypothetical protein VFB12_27010 [Ktedonobacteraceae bacterium]|nr:hypothetical protein [Ktedonobacteraceae bacterium]